MDKQEIVNILEEYKNGHIGPDAAVKRIGESGFEDLGFAKIDHHRSLRQGFPEVIYCEGKTAGQVAAIMEKLAAKNPNVLASRADNAMFEAVQRVLPDAVYNEQSRMIILERQSLPRDPARIISVVTAGTSDIPVAEEAALTAEIMGNQVERIYDVGVAGIHRLFGRLEDIKQANVLIVVAGMEGALASVVGGLVDRPVIAVPTSVGYGASFGGVAALLAMLNSCAAGVGVVNIDNGFGAGRLASMINKTR